MPLTLGTYPSQATSPAVLRGRDGSIRHCGGSATSIRSIVGVDGVPVSGYVRAKVLQKRTITRIGCAGHDRAGYPVSRVHLGHCRIIRGGPRGADTRRAARQALTGTASQAVITYRCAPPPGAALLTPNRDDTSSGALLNRKRNFLGARIFERGRPGRAIGLRRQDRLRHSVGVGQ